MNTRLALMMTVALAAGVCASCESELGPHPNHQQQVGAVQSPVDTGSALGEILTGSTATVPLVVVQTSPVPGAPPQVYTIVQGVQETFSNPPTTNPASAGPSTLPAPTHTHPVFGPLR